MPQDLPLNLLVERAQEDNDAATRRLGELTHAQGDSQQKLEVLLQYRAEYIARWQDTTRLGVDAAKLMNFHRFLGQLDAAVEQQRRQVQLAELATDQGRESWRSSHRKLKSFDALRQRHQVAVARRSAKREQRDSDEYAQRAHAAADKPFSSD